MEGIGRHGDLELLKWFRSDIQDGHHGSHLENLEITYTTEGLVWLSLNMMGGIGVIWKFRIAKILLFECPRWPPSWNSSNHISSQTVSKVEQQLDGRHQGEMEIQNCWIIQFQYPRWRPWWQSWNSSNNIRFWIAHDQPNPGERFLAHLGL